RRMEVLTHPRLDQLSKLGLSGMAQAFAELEASGEGAILTHSDWLGLLIDREVTHRRDKRLTARLRYARLRHHAVVEDVERDSDFCPSLAAEKLAEHHGFSVSRETVTRVVRARCAPGLPGTTWPSTSQCA